ncbi:Fic family protein [Pseudoduganella sp. UC29_71]|uniref:Fic family protein n=1 Tax=Pseudoduganella sp. UC29_71 TaxID=3350174 RepID=UPI003671F49F
MFNLEKTPYLLSSAAQAQVKKRLDSIEERVSLLRSQGTLSEKTIRDYYGDKRFEQVAESNAIEGSPLTAGETELAVMKGITISGHDPAYTKDAVALDKALTRISELARNASQPTDISQLHEVHGLLLGERLGAGIFRRERVKISGANHTPPKTWEEVMKQMEDWQAWSKENHELPAPIRAVVLHAWLTHVHPYIDGNGRLSRAIGNLELIRAGYPPIIIKKKERERYIQALAESDEGGDIRAFLELVFDRIEGSLIGLELSAKKRQAYNPALERIHKQQEKQLKIWETSVKLLASIVEHEVSKQLEAVNGTCIVKLFDAPLDFDDYLEVCSGHSVPQSWAFTIRLDVPGANRIEKLAYIGHRSARLHQYLNHSGGPSLYWSRKNPDGLPKWISDAEKSPFAIELTSKVGNGDEWFARKSDDSVEKLSTTQLAGRIAHELIQQMGTDE